MSQNKSLNIENIRKDFKYLANEKQVIYLDNASTTQKPDVVLNALSDYYRNSNANVHRGAYHLS